MSAKTREHRSSPPVNEWKKAEAWLTVYTPPARPESATQPQNPRQTQSLTSCINPDPRMSALQAPWHVLRHWPGEQVLQTPAAKKAMPDPQSATWQRSMTRRIPGPNVGPANLISLHRQSPAEPPANLLATATSQRSNDALWAAVA